MNPGTADNGIFEIPGRKSFISAKPCGAKHCQISVVLDEMMENFESTQSSPKKFVKPS